jgi:hypothetical protein
VDIERCSMESEKYITICEKDYRREAERDAEKGNVVIVDLSAGNAVTRQRMSPGTEAAIMNPVFNVIAVRGNCPLLLFAETSVGSPLRRSATASL